VLLAPLAHVDEGVDHPEVRVWPKPKMANQSAERGYMLK